MIYITQLIYLIEGRESIFDEFESVAIPSFQNTRENFYLEYDRMHRHLLNHK